MSLLLALTSGGGGSPIAIGASSSASGSPTTTAVATAATGSTFLVWVDDYYSMLTGVTDNKGNSYTPLGAAQTWTMAGSGWDGISRAFICVNGAGGSGHTVTVSGSSGAPEIVFVEVLNADTASPLDINDSSTVGSTANPVTSGAVASAYANELLIGMFGGDYNATGITWGNSFTGLATTAGTNGFTASVGYRVVNSTATYQASASRTSSFPSASMWFISLKQAAGGGGTTYTCDIVEVISLADAISAVMTMPGSISEAIALSDVQAAAAVFVSAVSEAVTLSDAQSAQMVFSASVTESLGLSDALTAQQVMVAALAESISLVDIQSSQMVGNVTIEESISLSDSQDATGGGGTGSTVFSAKNDRKRFS